MLGGVLRSRKFENQQTEAYLMAKILNRMTQIRHAKIRKSCLKKRHWEPIF